MTIFRTLTSPLVVFESRRVDTSARSPYVFDVRVANWLYRLWGLHCPGA